MSVTKELVKPFKVKVKRGYTLHIDGNYYQEGEILLVAMHQVEDQLWKVDFQKVPEEVVDVQDEEVEAEEVVEKNTRPRDDDGIVDVSEPNPEVKLNDEGLIDLSHIRKPSPGRRLFKQKK